MLFGVITSARPPPTGTRGSLEEVTHLEPTGANPTARRQRPRPPGGLPRSSLLPHDRLEVHRSAPCGSPLTWVVPGQAPCYLLLSGVSCYRWTSLVYDGWLSVHLFSPRSFLSPNSDCCHWGALRSAPPPPMFICHSYLHSCSGCFQIFLPLPCGRDLSWQSGSTHDQITHRKMANSDKIDLICSDRRRVQCGSPDRPIGVWKLRGGGRFLACIHIWSQSCPPCGHNVDMWISWA